MARPLRIEFPGAVYHVTSRGNARQPIYVDAADRTRFLDLLGEIAGRLGWLCHAYCLMGNHYHLLIETPRANLSRGMRDLNGRFTQYHNRRHERVGHLLQGRYKAILVDSEGYLLEVTRYIVLNPVRAGWVASAEDYAWSSFRATCGACPAPPWLEREATLSRFAGDRRGAVRGYRAFVAAGHDAVSPLEAVRGQTVLGDATFVAGLDERLERARGAREVPRVQRFVDRPGLDSLFDGLLPGDRAERDRRIRQASREFGYSHSEIARRLELHGSTVSKIMRRGSGLES